MNISDKVTIDEISKKITVVQTKKNNWWEKEREDNERRKQLAEAINLHGLESDGIPSILRHIYSMIESGTITARSTVNGLKPNSIDQIAANTANWWVSSVDAKRIFSELVEIPPNVNQLSACDANTVQTNVVDNNQNGALTPHTPYGTIKRWTPELVDELVAYKAAMGTQEAAKKYGVSVGRIRQIIRQQKQQPAANNPFLYKKNR